MTKWFVYSGTRYYPSCEVVEADTPAEAIATAYDDEYYKPFLVFPMDALALRVAWDDDEEAA